uniref:Uncharacterized protein n=1 Tax=uncultured Thiotrichaceae bacterium TaxID=298394 RepID=A0A6S6RZQ1_9GAMM|nr:MAG: Unknown protein [uncultured Thiotrichaceae bacterium]
MNRSDDKQLMSEQPWLKGAVEDLRRPVSPDVAGQLRAARRTALEQSKQKPDSGWNAFIGWQTVVTAGIGVVVVGFLVMFADQLQPEQDDATIVAKEQSGTRQMILEDLPIIAGQDDLQFYQDLEFIQWLEKEGSLDTQS